MLQLCALSLPAYLLYCYLYLLLFQKHKKYFDLIQSDLQLIEQLVGQDSSCFWDSTQSYKLSQYKTHMALQDVHLGHT